jgi:hypothetical protein
MANEKATGKLVNQLKFRGHYKYVLRPNESIQLSYDFVMTSIAKTPHTDVCNIQTINPAVGVPFIPAAFDTDNSQMKCNVLINESENLFRYDAPWLGIPNLDHMYDLPSFWYLPAGSSIRFKADWAITAIAANGGVTQYTIAPFTTGNTDFQPQLVISGYFVDEAPAEVREGLSRPMIMVFQHKPSSVNVAVNPSGTIGTDGITAQNSITIPRDKTFFIKKFHFASIRDISAGAQPANQSNYANQLYCDWIARITHNGSFNMQDKAERVDGFITNNRFPFELKRPAMVSGSNSVIVESTYTTGAPGSLIGTFYVFIGGQLYANKK